jgi:hypothetical protein
MYYTRIALLKFHSTKYYSSDQIKANQIGWAYNMHEGEKKCIQGLGKERDNLEDIGINGK